MAPSPFPPPFFIVRDQRIDLGAVNPMYAGSDVTDRVTLPAPDDQYARGTFPTPGLWRRSNEVPRIRFDGRRIIFPSPGQYYFYSVHGAFKFLVLSGEASIIDVIVQTAQFVSCNCVHSLADYWMTTGTSEFPFDTRALAQKFFASDQPLQLYCGEVVTFFATLLNRLGIIARKVHLFDDRDDGHVVLEALDPVTNEWIMMDPDYGIYLTNGANKILSLEEGMQCRDRGESLNVISLTDKHWLAKGYYVPAGFFGQKTWHPEDDAQFSPCEPGFYLEVWQKWSRFIYYAYRFSEDGWGVAFRKLAGAADR